MTSSNVLAQLGGEIAHQPVEAAERRADRDHAHAQRVVAQVGRKARDVLGDRGQLGIFAAPRDLAQARLRDHQLADQVDQVVEPLGGDADARRRLRGRLTFGVRLPHHLLLDRRGAHRGRRREPLLLDDLADALLRRQRLLELALGHVAALDEDLAQLLVLAVHVRRCVDPLDLQLALVLDEDEHVADGVDAAAGGQHRLPARVAGLGIELVEGRNRGGIGHDLAGAELAQLAQEQRRIGAVA